MSQRPLISLTGDKTRFTGKIIGSFPAHETFVEVFGGGDGILQAKIPSKVEVFNDIDGNLVNFYQVIRSPNQLKKLIRVLGLTVYSKQEFELAHQPTEDPVEGARRLMVRYYQSKGGLGEQWSHSINGSTANIASAVQRWHKAKERLLPAHQRFQNIQIEHSDFRSVFNRFDSKSTLFYVDSPYPLETGESGRSGHEMTMQDHEELVQILLHLKGTAVVSTYDHDNYNPLRNSRWKISYLEFPDFDSVPNHPGKMLWITPKPLKIDVHSFTNSSSELPTSSIEPNGRAAAAYRTRRQRINKSESAIEHAVADLKREGKKLTLVAISEKAKISREHLGRNYRDLVNRLKV